jgi:deazaflavin-dependent oxidoreductase (nitroreductase family)
VTEQDPRARYAAFMQVLIDDIRAHHGQVTQGPFAGRPVLLLTTTGAKSGLPRLTPVAYSRDADRSVIVASRRGEPTNPGWYHNLLAHPEVTVEAGGETFRARATVAAGAERDRLYAAHAALFPVFHDYQRATSRIIPVVLLDRIAR